MIELAELWWCLSADLASRQEKRRANSRDLFDRGRDFDKAELKEIAKRWFELSEAFISDPDLASAVYDIRRKYSKVKCGTGIKPWEIAGERLPARGEIPIHPAIAEYDPMMSRLLAFAQELQALAGVGDWYVPQRRATVEIGLVSESDSIAAIRDAGQKCNRWFKIMVDEELLKVTDPGKPGTGGAGRCTHFRCLTLAESYTGRAYHS